MFNLALVGAKVAFEEPQVLESSAREQRWKVVQKKEIVSSVRAILQIVYESINGNTSTAKNREPLTISGSMVIGGRRFLFFPNDCVLLMVAPLKVP